MRDNFFLFIVVGKAAVITTIGCFALVLGFKIAVTSGQQEILGATMAFLPAGIAAWWMFLKLKAQYTRREARAVGIAFAVVTPMSLLIGTLLAQIPGAYAAFLGRPFGLIGAFLGIVVMTAIVSFFPCLLALWITRRIERANQQRQ